MTKRRAMIGSVVALLLACAAAWAFGFFGGTDPAIAELKQMSEQLRDKNLSDAQKQQVRNDLRQRLDAMPDDQRHAYFESSREQWTGYAQQRMDEFFAMSKADQQKRLDEILDRMVKSQQQQNNQGANNGQSATNGRNRRGNMTAAQREARSKQRLDRTSPKMRAQFAEFRKQLDTRAQQRGINLGEQRGWGYGGGFGGFGGGRRGA